MLNIEEGSEACVLHEDALAPRVARTASKGRDEDALRSRLKSPSKRYPHYGYSTLQDMRRTGELVINTKRSEPPWTGKNSVADFSLACR